MKDLTLLVDEFMEACNCEATINETAYHFYELGYKECREQMLKEAVESEVESFSDMQFPEISVPLNPIMFKPGDKVRIIIVKED